MSESNRLLLNNCCRKSIWGKVGLSGGPKSSPYVGTPKVPLCERSYLLPQLETL